MNFQFVADLEGISGSATLAVFTTFRSGAKTLLSEAGGKAKFPTFDGAHFSKWGKDKVPP